MINKIIIAIIAILVVCGGVFAYVDYSAKAEAERVAQEKVRIEREQAAQVAEQARIAKEAEEAKKAESDKNIFKSSTSDFSFKLVASTTAAKTTIYYIDKSSKESVIKSFTGTCVVENMSSPLKNPVKGLDLPIIKCTDAGISTYIYRKSGEIKMATTKETCDDFTTCDKFTSTKVLGKF